ncbi:hypothetical protein [Methylocystis sp. B8]|uniref:hypothetical protein n=1 Tax=Methylocystis sp. B8 TaxID=544938 RepID=UPI0010FD0F40|nr:hypothetical protein [Methylocystis sp. B8]TLG71827.1 hypothetical protein FEV16_15120 [Methylocystis sp. B8]
MKARHPIHVTRILPRHANDANEDPFGGRRSFAERKSRRPLESAGLAEADLAALLAETPEWVASWLDGNEEMSGPAFLLALAIVRDKTDVSPYWIVTGQSAPASDRRLN